MDPVDELLKLDGSINWNNYLQLFYAHLEMNPMAWKSEDLETYEGFGKTAAAAATQCLENRKLNKRKKHRRQ